MNVPQTPRPEISVIIPVYNVEKHVRACIESLRNQTWTEFEAIVVDDGSTDGSARILVEAIGDDRRFRIIGQSNHGLSAARNVALDTARGRYITFLDGDDRYHPSFLSLMRTEAELKRADWVACAISFVRSDGTQLEHSAIHGVPACPAFGRASTWPMGDWRSIVRHFPSVWNKIYRADFIGDLRFVEGTYYEDHEFFCSLASRSGPLTYLNLPLYLHTRGRPGQITAEDSDRVFAQFDVLESVRNLTVASSPSGKDAGFGRLAIRLLGERAQALRDPDRRKRYAVSSRAYLARSGLAVSKPELDVISPVLAAEMDGIDLLVSVAVIWPDLSRPIQPTLDALARQTGLSFEICIVAGADIQMDIARRAVRLANLANVRLEMLAGRSVAALRNLALDRASGAYVTLLNAGDTLPPGALLKWTDAMLRHSSDVGLAWVNPLGAAERFALKHPTGNMFRSEFLRDKGLHFGGTLQDEERFLRHASRHTESIAPLCSSQLGIWTEPSTGPQIGQER